MTGERHDPNMRSTPIPHRQKTARSVGRDARPSAQARLFRNGASQAVRLPKAFRMPGHAVWIHREGERIVLEPIAEQTCDANGWSLTLQQDLARLRAGLDLDEFCAPVDPVPEPIAALDDV